MLSKTKQPEARSATELVSTFWLISNLESTPVGQFLLQQDGSQAPQPVSSRCCPQFIESGRCEILSIVSLLLTAAQFFRNLTLHNIIITSHSFSEHGSEGQEKCCEHFGFSAEGSEKQWSEVTAQRADTVASLNSPVSSLDDPHQSDQEHYWIFRHILDHNGDNTVSFSSLTFALVL